MHEHQAPNPHFWRRGGEAYRTGFLIQRDPDFKTAPVGSNPTASAKFHPRNNKIFEVIRERTLLRGNYIFFFKNKRFDPKPLA